MKTSRILYWLAAVAAMSLLSCSKPEGSDASDSWEDMFEQPEVQTRWQNIPHIYIDIDGQEIKDKKNYVKGTITVKDPERLYSDVEEFTAEMGIRGRGNSTWEWPKKPYKIKLDSKASILGFPADKEWCILANYSDRSLLRNLTAMKLSELCGFSWTPRMCSVEVTIDGKYQGVYNFCEHKKISADRVNIEVAGENDNEGDALTGGYYFEIDARAEDTDPHWHTTMDVPMLFSDPEEPTEQQFEYARENFEAFEAVLKARDFSEQTGYRKYIDMKSFIDYYIVQELTKNVDGCLNLSTFLTKERGKKLEMYHLWDFDLTLGNCGYFNDAYGNGPENFYIRYSAWYRYMFEDPQFIKELKTRWNSLYPDLKTMTQYIEQQAFYLEQAQVRNFQTWNIRLSVDWVNMPSKGSYEAELKYLMDFYTARLNWLHTELNKL